jgi:osmotically-inducible protein OsmY
MKTDLEIQTNVMNELKWEPFLNSSEIGVAVKDGVVTLSGTVNAYSKKISAENAAKRVFGVKAVAEEIEVRLSPSDRKNDSDIAAAIVDALKWQSAVQENRIKVKVENGWVSLDGEVEWEFQREAARNVIINLNGVWAVTNNIRVVPKLTATDIKQKIALALQRDATIDSQKIKVEARGSKVILSGSVRSWVERKDAEQAAWCAPGVSSVENNIELKSEILVPED